MSELGFVLTAVLGGGVFGVLLTLQLTTGPGPEPPPHLTVINNKCAATLNWDGDKYELYVSEIAEPGLGI